MTDNNITTTTTTTTSLAGGENYTALHENENADVRNNGGKNKQIPSPSSSSRSLKKSYSQLNLNKKLIVFVSSSKYQWLIAFLVVAPLFAILMSIIMFDVQSQEEYKNSSRIWSLGWLFILIMIVYMAVLPRQLDVRSNGTVAIKTCLLTFHIDEIARAYRGCNIESDYDFFLRPRLRFATSLDRDAAVVIRRHQGKWDVVLTPQDPEGFVHAVEEVLRQNEDQQDENFVYVEGRQEQRKPTLSSTSSSQPV
mmetsp:Transcript_11435/g.26862  ORF Transcript_11435/g.26862 Transcript_11435/m.26862 type:complete len:252 (+) Transcript_11435:330-1085(+)